jgi:hypothetical protein
MIDEQKLRELAEDIVPLSVNGLIEFEDVKEASEAILALLDELQSLRSERTALLVNEQNLREDLEALRASLVEPVAWINKDHTYVELSTPSTVYGSHTIPLYALTNKDQA